MKNYCPTFQSLQVAGQPARSIQQNGCEVLSAQVHHDSNFVFNGTSRSLLVHGSAHLTDLCWQDVHISEECYG